MNIGDAITTDRGSLVTKLSATVWQVDPRCRGFGRGTIVILNEEFAWIPRHYLGPAWAVEAVKHAERG